MRQQPISRESKDIIDAMRVLIEKGETDHLKKSVTGWQYGGTNFTGLVASLHEEMKQELQRQDMHVSVSLYLSHAKLFIDFLIGGRLHRAALFQRRQYNPV
jgi:hypothetical protein